MSKIKFILGLTDEESENYFYDNLTPPEIKRYNLYKLMPEIEKATLEWDMRTDLPAFQHAYDAFRKIIVRPHLNMITIRSVTNRYIPDENDIHLHVEFVNLIPVVNEEFYGELTDTDFENVSMGAKFGSLTLQFLDSLPLRDDNFLREHTLINAYHSGNLKYLKHSDDFKPLAIPNFRVNFDLGNTINPRTGLTPHQVEWMEKNKDILDELGYTIDAPKSRVGELVVGKLIGDPWEAYQKIKSYNRICRLSFFTIEE